MTRPFLAAGIEEPRALTSLGIDAAEVRAFMVIVGKAGEREIAGDRLAPVLFGNDVIDLEHKLIVDPRHSAILTTLVCAFPDELGKSDVHGRSSAAAGTLENLPSFRFERGKNRANALEVVHL